MVKPVWMVVNKKLFLILVVVIIALAGLYRGAGSYIQQVRVPPEETLSAALNNTLNSSSFHFTMVVKIANKTISNVEGDWATPGSVHIKGTMQDLPVEFIHVGDKTFIKGYWSDNWTSLEGNKMAESELFVTEFNPLGNFNFKDIPSVQEAELKEPGKLGVKVLEFSPMVQNSLMELNYDDFCYRVWVDPKEKVISKALIKANGDNGNNSNLEITMELADYNKEIKIEPPSL